MPNNTYTMRMEYELLKEIDIRKAMAMREIEKRDKIIEDRNKIIKDREKTIKDRERTIKNAIVAMSQNGMSDEEIATSLGLTPESVRPARQ